MLMLTLPRSRTGPRFRRGSAAAVCSSLRLLLRRISTPSIAVLLAEVVHHYFPKYVELHNYSSANSVRQKLYNWSTLNRAYAGVRGRGRSALRRRRAQPSVTPLFLSRAALLRRAVQRRSLSASVSR